MAKSKKCLLVMNTRSGYIMSPIKCKSMAEAKRIAEKMGFAYRIFPDD